MNTKNITKKKIILLFAVAILFTALIFLPAVPQATVFTDYIPHEVPEESWEKYSLEYKLSNLKEIASNLDYSFKLSTQSEIHQQAQRFNYIVFSTALALIIIICGYFSFRILKK